MNKYLSPLEKQILKEQLQEYTSHLRITKSERKHLRLWINTGHDTNSNPWAYRYENGWEMDYITALRLDEETYETIKRMAEES